MLTDRRQRLRSATWADIAELAAGRLLEEDHYLDLKRDVAPGDRGTRELAKDLAAFTVDGGDLLIGLDEDASPPALVPVDLAGLPERIENVARMSVDPPVHPFVRMIAAPDDASRGLVLVQVAPSAEAPHMVGHRYYGRGERTSYPLSDAEVLRLHERRRIRADEIGAQLTRAIDADPVILRGERLHAHLFVVAIPTMARDDMLLSVVGDDWPTKLRPLVVKNQPDYPSQHSWGPDVGYLSQPMRLARGWSLASHHFEEGRRLPPQAKESTVIELQFTEKGELELFCGRASDTAQTGERLFPAVVVGLVRRTLVVASNVAEAANYWGTWELGVAVTGIRGVPRFRDAFASLESPAHETDEYRATTSASFDELRGRAGTVTERLIGRFVRALGGPDATVRFLVQTD